MGDKYTLKQILFALRKEFLDKVKRDNELKKYFILNGDNTFIDLSVNEKWHDLIVDFNQIRTLLDRIMFKFLGYPYNSNDYFLSPYYAPIKDKYYFRGKEAFSITDVNQLLKELEILFNLDFAQHIDGLSTNVSYKGQDYKLHFFTSGICLYKQGEKLPRMIYKPKHDKIIIEPEERIITPDYIQEFLELSFDMDNVKDDTVNYISKIIETHEEKEIYIPENFKSKKVNLKIIEEPKKLILTPKKNIRRI